MSACKNKIDVHHHVYHPVFTEALERAGGDPSGWYIPPWTKDLDQGTREATGTTTAILSKLARACNEHNAKLRDAEPSTYGFFAAVPNLLNTKAALEEIDYAFDTLHADGVTLFTRYGDDNHYLGHPDLTPIWDALNARKAVVFVHPTHPVDTHLVNSHLPQPAYDYPHETGRAAIDMITLDMLRDHAADCKIILSHAGGDLPYVIDRIAGLLTFGPASIRVERSAAEILAKGRRFYYDTALNSGPMHLKALLELLGPENADHVLFGSDFPNAPEGAIKYYTEQLERTKELDVAALRTNALELFSRLRS